MCVCVGGGGGGEGEGEGRWGLEEEWEHAMKRRKGGREGGMTRQWLYDPLGVAQSHPDHMSDCRTGTFHYIHGCTRIMKILFTK